MNYRLIRQFDLYGKFLLPDDLLTHFKLNEKIELSSLSDI